jgi:histidine triad (HIT) family protein
MENCIFCRIRDKEVAKEFTYEDEYVMVFPDIAPSKPVHLLIVPKKHIKEFHAVKDPVLFSKVGQIITQLIAKFDLQEKGYRVVTNGGGAQVVDHLHFHLLGPLGNAVKM